MSTMLTLTLCVCTTLFALVMCKPLENDVTNLELRMPGVQPQVPDIYLCHSLKIDKSTYISGFIPHGDMHTAHHILLFGCSEPGSDADSWNCGEMHKGDHGHMHMAGMDMPVVTQGQGHGDDRYKVASPPCKGQTKIIYAWAMNAPELKLPEGVGFHVGGDTDIQHVVVQIHYTDVSKFLPPKNEKDNSGVTLVTSSKPTTRQAGVYLLATGGELPPQSTTYLETACPLEENVVLHPFAYRVHAHSHGQVTSGYRIRDGKWAELGRQSPQKAQMFYPITTADVTVSEGDILAARCTMVNNENHTISIGSTQHDEMCNFYIMYWVEGSQLPQEDYCVSSDGDGWSSEETVHVENAPADASMVPDTKEVLKATHRLMSDMAEDERQMEEDVEEMLSQLWQPQYEQEEEDDTGDVSDMNMDGMPDMDQWRSQDDFDAPYNRMAVF